MQMQRAESRAQMKPRTVSTSSSAMLNGNISLLEGENEAAEAVEPQSASRMDVVMEAETVHYRPMFSRARTDTIKEKITLTMSKLISWSEQVANGMDYLSSKNVVHGDLACRYVLCLIYYLLPF